MDYIVILLLQIGSAIASLVLLSIGLAVIFGMMRVINLAHGEFLMLGGYAAITAYNLGVNLWIAMLVVAPVTVGLFGALVERLVIRHLYGRLIDTMLATWGLEPGHDRLRHGGVRQHRRRASPPRSAASRSAPTAPASTSCS